MAKVYTVLIQDRHSDPAVHVFISPVSAIRFANEKAHEYCRFPEDFNEGLTSNMGKAGWLYYATYSCEGDSVRVMSTELQ